jgi:hypothetical protein
MAKQKVDLSKYIIQETPQEQSKADLSKYIISENKAPLKKKESIEPRSMVSPSPTKVQNTPSDLPSKSEEVGYLEDLWNRFKGAGTKALSSLVAIPSLAQNAAMDMVLTASGKDEEFNKLPVSVKKDIRNAIKKTALDPTSIAAVKSQEASDYLNKKADKIYEKTIKQEGDIFTDMNNFRKNPSLEGAGQVISRAIRSGVESIPYMGMMALPGGLVTMGLASTAQKRNEDLAENQNAGLGNLLTAGAHGAAEAYFEKYTQGILGRAGKLLKGDTKASSEFAKGIVKEIAKDFNIEGTSEGLTTAVQEVADKLNKGEDVEFIPLMRKIADSYLLGGATGAGITGGAAGIKSAADKSVAAKNYVLGKIMPTEQKKKLEALTSQRQNLEFEKGADSNPVVKKVVDDKISEIENEYNTIINEANSMYDSMTDDEIKSVISIDNDLEDNYNKAKTIMEDETLDQDAKDLLLKDLLKKQNELKQQRDAVQKQATSKVSVQPEAAVGGEVAQGEPEAKPEVTTEEGQVEEVKPESGGMVQMAETPTEQKSTEEINKEREVYGLEPLKPTYRGTSLDEWENVKNGGTFKSEKGFGDNEAGVTWVSDNKEYSDEYVNSNENGVLIEFKPEAIDKSTVESGQENDKTGIRLGRGLTLEDVQKVTDANGNVLYEAEAKPTEEVVTEQPIAEAPSVEEEVKNPFDQVKQGPQAKQKAVDQIEKAIKRGRSLPQAVQGGIAALRKTIAYEEANDVVREAMERQIRKDYGLKEKSAPSVKKLFPVKSVKELVDTMKGLKEQIKLEAKAAKGGAVAFQNASKELLGKIKALGKTGKLTPAQVSRLNKLFSKNLLSKNTFDAAVETATKIVENSQYAKRLDDLGKIRKKLKSFTKNDKKYQADVVEALKKFTKVDPSNVDNLDEYESIAMELLRATKPITATKEGEVVGREAAYLNRVNKFADKEIAKQEERLKNALLDQYQYLVDEGKISSDMTYKQIVDYIAQIENNEGSEDSSKSDAIKEYTKNAFSDLVDEYNNTKEYLDEVDPLVDEFAKMDIEKLPLPKQIMAVDAMQNYLVNGITTNMQAILNPYKGALNAEANAKSGLKAQPIKVGLIGRAGKAGQYFSNIWGEYISKTDSLLANAFRSSSKAIKFMKDSGFAGVVKGFVEGKKIVNTFAEQYTDKYKDTKPNNQDFNTAYNTYERGIFAALYRTSLDESKGSRDAEFNRQKGLLKETIDALKESGNSDLIKKAEIYEQVYDKIKDDENIDEVKEIIDPINQDAVQTMVDFWKKYYPEFKKIAAEVYNVLLDEDLNYTPEMYEKILNEVSDDLLSKGSFRIGFDFVNTEKAGNLLKNNKVKTLPKSNGEVSRVRNYDFDMGNINALERTLIDIYTTPSVQQYLGYVGSDAFKQVFPDAEQRNLIKSRLNFNIDALRGRQNTSAAPAIKAFSNLVGSLSKYGTRIGLGSVSSIVKQSAPMAANTIVNLGPNNAYLISDGVKDLYNNDALDFLRKSGYGISLRGSESQTSIDYAEKLIEKSDISNAKKLANAFAKTGDFYIEQFLKRPDVAVANISWFAYYRQKLKQLGLDGDNIDWKNHKLNEEAADYAEFMVQDQQNMNIAELGGKLLASKNPGVKVARQLLFPFASYLFNLKDKNNRAITILTSKNSNKEDKIEAFKSLSAGIVESVLFDALAGSISYLLMSGAYATLGADDESEEKLRQLNQMLSVDFLKKLSMTKLLTDFAMPIAPQMDNITVDVANYLLDLFDTEEEAKKKKRAPKSAIGKQIKAKEDRINEPFRFYSKESNFLDLVGGVPAIGAESATQLWNDAKDAFTGKSTDKYGNVTKYNDEQKKMIMLSIVPKLLAASNLLPRESLTYGKDLRKIIDEKAKRNPENRKGKKKKFEGF